MQELRFSLCVFFVLSYLNLSGFKTLKQKSQSILVLWLDIFIKPFHVLLHKLLRELGIYKGSENLIRIHQHFTTDYQLQLRIVLL